MNGIRVIGYVLKRKGKMNGLSIIRVSVQMEEGK